MDIDCRRFNLMGTKVSVSIIIPIYNVQDYIIECLDSVAMQTYDGSLECILVDDCGNDDSVLLAEEFVETYKGNISFRIIHHEYNKGLSCARNTGMSYARGEYLFFLDSDDTITNNCIELLISYVTKYPGVDIVQGSIRVGKDSWAALPENIQRDYSEDREWIRENMCIFTIPDPAWNKLVRTKFVTDNNLLFADGLIQEDTLWAYALQKYINSMAFCFKDTYIYRFNPEGIMNVNTGVKEAISFAKICNVVLNDLKQRREIMPYEIMFLELNATRIHNTGGEDALYMLNLYRNPIFRLLYMLKKRTYKGSRWLLCKGKIRDIIVKYLRCMLCNRHILSINCCRTEVSQ